MHADAELGHVVQKDICLTTRRSGDMCTWASYLVRYLLQVQQRGMAVPRAAVRTVGHMTEGMCQDRVPSIEIMLFDKQLCTVIV